MNDPDEVEIDLSHPEAFDEYSEPVDWEDLPEEDREEAEEQLAVEPEVERKVPSKGALSLVLRQRLSPIKGILDLPSPEWFIERLLPVGEVTILHGQSGTKKSFLLLDWALCAATGRIWHGHPLRPGKVLYIVAEGIYGTGKRIRAWAAQHRVDPYTLRRIDFMALPINLFSITFEQANHWADVVAYLHYDYIVIDTLHMSSAGADENSSKDMGLVFKNARTIAGERAKLFFAHHDPKDGSKTGRGSGSIRDDADVVLRLAEKEKDSPISVLHAEKIKDGPAFAPVAILFEEWQGEHETSLYVAQVNTGADAVVSTKPASMVDKCCATIVEHGLLDLGYGFGRTREYLVTAGYTYGKNTIADALHRLKIGEHEVDMMNRRKDVT
jgi:hypothetical protein